jgi:hypothetical protein
VFFKTLDIDILLQQRTSGSFFIAINLLNCILSMIGVHQCRFQYSISTSDHILFTHHTGSGRAQNDYNLMHCTITTYIIVSQTTAPHANVLYHFSKQAASLQQCFLCPRR